MFIRNVSAVSYTAPRNFTGEQDFWGIDIYVQTAAFIYKLDLYIEDSDNAYQIADVLNAKGFTRVADLATPVADIDDELHNVLSIDVGECVGAPGPKIAINTDRKVKTLYLYS